MRLEEMAAFFKARLDGYDEHMRREIEGAEEFYPYTAQALLEGLPDSPEILDLGCGTGLELEEIFRLAPGARAMGIDLSPDMLGALRAKLPGRELKLIEGSYFEVPLGERAFDAAVSVESLHHFTFEEKLGLYRRLREALRPGGCFVLTDYFAESPWHEEEYFRLLEKMKREQGLPEGSYHFDTPLTVEHEIQALMQAGFAGVETLRNWGNTYCLRAMCAVKVR